MDRCHFKYNNQLDVSLTTLPECGCCTCLALPPLAACCCFYSYCCSSVEVVLPLGERGDVSEIKDNLPQPPPPPLASPPYGSAVAADLIPMPTCYTRRRGVGGEQLHKPQRRGSRARGTEKPHNVALGLLLAPLQQCRTGAGATDFSAAAV